jgi:hypothetical protein
MEQTQEKIKECISKQSTTMEGLERLSKQLGNSMSPEPRDFNDEKNSMTVENGVADALETTEAPVARDFKGENKAPKRKTRLGRKYSYMLRAKGVSKGEKLEKPKPKFFCQF